MIYFIQAKKPDALIKIGHTAGDVRTRCSQIQTSTADQLEVVGVLDGDEDREKELHRRFASDRIRGEWFNSSDAIRTFIHQEARPLPPLEPIVRGKPMEMRISAVVSDELVARVDRRLKELRTTRGPGVTRADVVREALLAHLPPTGGRPS